MSEALTIDFLRGIVRPSIFFKHGAHLKSITSFAGVTYTSLLLYQEGSWIYERQIAHPGEASRSFGTFTLLGSLQEVKTKAFEYVLVAIAEQSALDATVRAETFIERRRRALREMNP